METICNSKGVDMVSIPSSGKLRLHTPERTYYPPHHWHYYDKSTNVECGLEVAGIQFPSKLETNSPGYSVMQALADGDGVIVSLPVAKHLALVRPRVKQEVFILGAKQPSVQEDAMTDVPVNSRYVGLVCYH